MNAGDGGIYSGYLCPIPDKGTKRRPSVGIGMTTRKILDSPQGPGIIAPNNIAKLGHDAVSPQSSDFG